MSNILFANQDRLKTIGRFLIYDRVVSANQYNLELEQEFKYKGKRYVVEAKVKEISATKGGKKG